VKGNYIKKASPRPGSLSQRNPTSNRNTKRKKRIIEVPTLRLHEEKRRKGIISNIRVESAPPDSEDVSSIFTLVC